MSTEYVARTGEGSVVALWRYPVKSMMGEELNASAVTDRGLLGDRAYALVDRSDGKVASAKNPRKWPQLFDFRAAFVEPARPGAPMPPSAAIKRSLNLHSPIPGCPRPRSTGRTWRASTTGTPSPTSRCLRGPSS